MIETNHAQENAKCGLASIREMMAALNCDYDRLEELRDERDDYEPDDAEERAKQTGEKNSAEMWTADNPDEAEELAELEAAAGECADRDEAQQRIDEDPLSIEVRSDWHQPGQEVEDAEYCILLTTGGPALRIIGELRDGEPHSARLEYQDWGTPWTEYITTGEDHKALLAYASCFFFGS